MVLAHGFGKGGLVVLAHDFSKWWFEPWLSKDGLSSWFGKWWFEDVVLGWIGDMTPIENKCSAMSPSWAVVIGWMVIAHDLANGGLRGIMGILNQE